MKKHIPDFEEIREFSKNNGFDIFKSDDEIEKEEREKSERRKADFKQRVLN